MRAMVERYIPPAHAWRCGQNSPRLHEERTLRAEAKAIIMALSKPVRIEGDGAGGMLRSYAVKLRRLIRVYVFHEGI